MQPAGFARYVPCRACDISDTMVNGHAHPAFAELVPLLDLVRTERIAPEAMAQRIERFLLEHQGPKVRQEERILACQTALRDQDVASVDDLCARVGVSRRTLERLCCSYFGFPPKMLLRRQRFLRSLAQFTVAGAENWSRALDEHYYDQAHFVHDFKAFMGVTPTEYAAAPHPVLERIIVQRMADQGALPQGAPGAGARTDLPTLLRYGKIA